MSYKEYLINELVDHILQTEWDSFNERRTKELNILEDMTDHIYMRAAILNDIITREESRKNESK